MSPLRTARRVVRLGLGLALFLTVFVDAAALVVPIYDMQLYDRVMLSRNMDTVAMLSVACIGGLSIYGMLDYLRQAALVAIAERAGRALSVAVLEAAVRQGMDGRSGAGADALRDLNNLQNFLSSGAVSAPLDALCAPLLLAVLWLLHPAFFWLAAMGVSALTLLGILADILVRPKLTAAAEARSRASHAFAAGLAEPDLIDGLGMFPALARRWTGRYAASQDGMRFAEARAHHATAASSLIRLGAQAGLMAMGAVLVIGNHASPGGLMGGNLLLAKTLSPFDALIASWRRWIAADEAWKRLNALLAEQDTGIGPAAAGDGKGLELSGVTFRVHGTSRAVLNDVTLVLAPGTATALTGANGAGKSTLLRTMVGVALPSEGTVRLDGKTLDKAGRDRVGYLPQGSQLLVGTVAENVGRFLSAPVEDTIDATRAAGMHEIVGRLPRGYETQVGQAAATLSGGQQQRVALARALFGGPRLLVLDEPDASLDLEGEDALVRAIGAARAAGCVVVVATHRPGLLAHMDRTLVVRDGHVEDAVPLAAAPAGSRFLALS